MKKSTIVKLKQLFSVIGILTLSLFTPAHADTASSVIVVEKSGKETLLLSENDADIWQFTVDPVNKVASVRRNHDPKKSGERLNVLYKILRPSLLVYCDHESDLHPLIKIENRKTPGLTSYTVSSGDEKVRGGGVVLDRGFLLSMHQRRSFIIESLMNGRDVTITVDSDNENSKNYVFSYDGFAEAFNYSCSTHPNYEKVTGLPRQDNFQSACVPDVLDDRCQLPTNTAISKIKGLALLQAVGVGNYSLVNSLLGKRPDNYTELDYFGAKLLADALHRSVLQETPKITQRLINAGASHGSLISHAISNNDEQLLSKLVKAGFRLGDGIKDYKIEDLVQKNKFEIIDVLIAGGVEFDSPTRSNWSLLMVAIESEYREMAEKLLPVSNVLHYSKSIAEAFGGKSTLKNSDTPSEINALGLAKLATWENSAQFVSAIEKQADQMNDSAGVGLMYLQTDLELGRFEKNRGNYSRAQEYFSSGIKTADIPAITIDTQGAHIVASMNLLFQKHETQVMLGEARSEEDIALSMQLTNLGGWFKPLHDMLSVFESEIIGNQKFTNSDWEQLHGLLDKQLWDPKAMNKWIESQPDAKLKARLTATMDYFTK